MKACGIDISSHRGRQMTSQMAHDADLILVMDSEQKEWCTHLVPSTRGRIFLLGHWLSERPLEIADPYGQDIAAFHVAFEDIHRSVLAWVPHLNSERRFA
jgi:protein-tyrosine phosphatase